MKARLTFISDGGAREIGSRLIVEVPPEATGFTWQFICHPSARQIGGGWTGSVPIPRPKKVKKEGWINIYRGGLLGGALCATEGEAKKIASGEPAATIKIEWEEENE